MSPAKNKVVNDMLSIKDNSNMTNAKIFYAAKRKHISECIDDGQLMVMPNNLKWHGTHRADLEFVQRINTASMGAMIHSFKKLIRPKSGRGDNESSRLYQAA